MPLKDTKFKYGQTVIKIIGYGNLKQIQVTYLNCVRNKGVEVENDSVVLRSDENDNSKTLESIYRSKRVIKELSSCNPWDYFCTMTIDSEKYDRTDLNGFFQKFRKFINNQNRLHNLDIKYLFIPELHKDGLNWHLHGFMYNLPLEMLKRFQIGDKMGQKIADKVLNGEAVYNWTAYADRFGFCDLEPIKDQRKASSYITKYINKNLIESVTKLNAHKYYHSKGLKKAEFVKQGSFYGDISYCYENDYCKIAIFDYSEKLLSELCNHIVK